MITSPDIKKETPSCSNMSQNQAVEKLKELGYEDVDSVPTSPTGRHFFATLVLIAKGYDFGGITFQEAQAKLHYTDWRSGDATTSEMIEILKTGDFRRDGK